MKKIFIVYIVFMLIIFPISALELDKTANVKEIKQETERVIVIPQPKELPEGINILEKIKNMFSSILDTFRKISMHQIKNPCANIRDNEIIMDGDVAFSKKYLCYNEKAQGSGDIRICNFFEKAEHIEECISGVARQKSDLSLCDKINNEKTRESCKKNILADEALKKESERINQECFDEEFTCPANSEEKDLDCMPPLNDPITQKFCNEPCRSWIIEKCNMRGYTV